MKAKGYVVQGLISTHQSAIREAPTVFSRLPSLMEADKPCPLLQPSLLHMTCPLLARVTVANEERGHSTSAPQKSIIILGAPWGSI